jgi:ATP-dependent Clp protease ATP-binding subunit ClpX
MVGQTGTGTLVAKRFTKMLDVPLAIRHTILWTLVGEDVESILTRLLQAADYDVGAGCIVEK